MSKENETLNGSQNGNDFIADVTCRFLEVGDVVYYTNMTGSFSHQYEWLDTKVTKITKTLAYCDNGMKVYRKPRSRTNGGYRYFVKNGDAVYPNNNGR